MKLLSTIFLFAFTIAFVYASGGEANNEITYYGCPDECSAQRGPSCKQFNDDNLPSHFAALSKKLPGYDSFCGHYAVYMMSDGSNVETLSRATVVDSCSSCAKYHLDLSLTAFKEIREKSKGTGKVIWGIYSKSGSRLAGPFYNSVDGSARKLGMSEDTFISSFDANAKNLAASSSSTRRFNSSSSSSDIKKNDSSSSSSSSRTSSRTTSSRTTTRTTTRTYSSSYSVASANSNVISTKTIATKTLPAKILQFGSVSTQSTTTFNPINALGAATTTVAAISQQSQLPQSQSVEQAIKEDKKKEEGEEDGGLGTIGIIAIAGGSIGAAGAGLLFMKKKNPRTYESVKQKFPDAFSNVKRGISRRATSIKRVVTKKSSKSNTINI